MTHTNRLGDFLSGVIVGAAALWVYLYILMPTFAPPARVNAQPASVVYQQAPARVLVPALSDQLAQGTAYTPR